MTNDRYGGPDKILENKNIILKVQPQPKEFLNMDQDIHVPNTDASKQVIANTTNNTKRADDYSPIGSPTNIGHAPETLESRRLTDKR